MEKSDFTEEDILHSLVASLNELPDSNASFDRGSLPITAPRKGDALVRVAVGGRELRLLVEAKREAYPRDIRDLLWQFRNYLAHLTSPGAEVIPFIAARSISRGARDLLRDERVGFYDLGGSLFIPGRDFYIFVDRPPPKRSRHVLSIFEGQKARTMLTLFAFGDEWVGVTELAELAEVSPATASATLSAMEQHDWVETQGSGPSKVRRLRDRKALVDEWGAYIAQRKPPKAVHYYVPSAGAEDLCQKLDRACRSANVLYAVTGEAAAQLYTPYLSTISQVRCRIAPGRSEGRILEQIDARQVSEGWNLAVLETRGRADIIVGDEIDGISLAPPLQVYLDLLRGPSRSKEMAAHLRTERLGV
jgi:hypothetical protein